MKIALLYRWTQGPHPSGVATYVNAVLKELDKYQHVETEIHSVAEEQRDGDGLPPSVSTYELRGGPVQGLLELRRLLSNIKKGDYDVINIQGATLPYGIIPTLARKTERTVLTLHGLPWVERSFAKFNDNHRSAPFAPILTRYLTGHVKTVVVASRFMASSINRFSPKNIEIIPHGYDPALREITPGIAASDNVLYFGRLAYEKGPHLLIEAISHLRARGYIVSLHIAGDGPLRRHLERLVSKMGLENSVAFHGSLGISQLRSLLSGAGICVFPSLYEAYGIACLEAMAAGRLVIASNVGGLAELINHGKNGFLFSGGSSKQLSERLADVLDNYNALKGVGEEARKSVASLSWPNAIARLLRVFERVSGGTERD